MKLFISLVFLISVSFSCSYITSGEIGMTYYSFAQKLSSKVDGICVTKSTGSPRNLYNITAEDSVVMGLFQSDIIKSAKEGYDYKQKLQTMELLFPIEEEKVHLVVLKNSRINTLQDLRKRDIAVGDKLSGSYLTFLFVSKKLDIEWVGFNYSLSDGMIKLKNGEVDAVFVVSVAPVPEIQRYSDSIRFIDITETIRGYKKTTISGSVYGTKKDTKTLGVDTLLTIDSKKINSSNKKVITDMVNAYIDMKLDDSKVVISGKNQVDIAVKKVSKGFGDFLKKTVQGEDLAGQKKQNKLQKVESICQTDLNSVSLYGLKRSQIVVDACHQYTEKVKKEKFTDYEFN